MFFDWENVDMCKMDGGRCSWQWAQPAQLPTFLRGRWNTMYFDVLIVLWELDNSFPLIDEMSTNRLFETVA